VNPQMQPDPERQDDRRQNPETQEKEQRDADWLAVRDSFSRLVAAAPHELIGPLNQASSLVALYASRHRNQDGEEAETLLSLIESATARMQATVAGLRAWFDVAGGTCRRESVDMDQILRMALYLIDRQIKEAEATVSFDKLPRVQGDADRLTELVRILVGNAVKFRRPEVRPEVCVSARTSGNTCVFSIADNGIGVEPAYRDRLFFPFRKLNGHTWPGCGMGLVVAKTIVDIHKGSIWIDSAPSGGTVVSFSLTGGM
jgi:light-regulated signal transduction histidine kinase (bacteriophytochrome)